MPAGHEQFFRWRDVGGVALFEVLARELNNPNVAREFGARLKNLVAIRASNRMVLDFQLTKYMSSTAFGALMEFAKAADARGVRIALCGLSPEVRIGADVLCLGRFIPILDNAEAAIESLRPHPVAVPSPAPPDGATG